ncbi:hypothetical protein ACFL9T_21340 [Thermodesulfobacteriota bacterium]
MRRFYSKIQGLLGLASLCLVMWALSGCAMVGPKSISAGRADYNEAINKTEDEQMLLSIVKGRYGETFSLLAVTGVAANVRFRTNAGVEAGFGPEKNYLGNLTPFSAGLAYEENPTITYAPVQGEQYLRQFMSPIPLDILLLGLRSMTSGDHLFTLLVNRINDLRSPDFIEAPSAEPDPRFMRFVELLTELRKAGLLDFVRDPRKEVAFDAVVGGYAHQYSKKVREFLTLLDLQMPADESEDIVIPVYHTVRTIKFWGIGITTRSTYDLIEILRASVEVPPEHGRAGLTINYPPMGLLGKGVRIISSTEKPNNRSLAVKYRGYWFYIDEIDQRTKAFFRVLRTFWSVSIAATSNEKAAPVLTIPVSR